MVTKTFFIMIFLTMYHFESDALPAADHFKTDQMCIIKNCLPKYDMCLSSIDLPLVVEESIVCSQAFCLCKGYKCGSSHKCNQQI